MDDFLEPSKVAPPRLAPFPDLPTPNQEFFQVLRRRRSIRAYLERSVENEKLQLILAAANSAPSAGNLQAFEMVVVRDEASRRALVPATHNQAFVATAPVLLIFFANAKRSEAKYGPQAGAFFALQDATIACAYAELAVAALGLGTVWIGAPDPSAVALVTGLNNDWKPVGLLPIGYSAEEPAPTSRRPLHEVVHQCRGGSPDRA